MRRVVLDTNTVVSAFLWHGVSHALFRVVRRRPGVLFASPFLMNELAEVLSRRKFDAMFERLGISRADVLQRYTVATTLIYPVRVPDAVPNDQTDNNVLACALAADADVIVSGDRHLLSLNGYEGMEIMSAGDCLARLEQEFA